MNEVELANKGLFNTNLTSNKFLNVQEFSKLSYAQGEFFSNNLLFDAIITLSDEGIVHQVKEFDFVQVMMDIGGFTVALLACFKILNYLY